jgi:transcriptional/translational regulatory protein YebC/TACO1
MVKKNLKPMKKRKVGFIKTRNNKNTQKTSKVIKELYKRIIMALKKRGAFG